MERCLEEVEKQLRALSCEEVAADEDLGWTFEDVVAGWSVSIVLDGAVAWEGSRLAVPMLCQARRGRGLRSHQGDTVWRQISLECNG